MQKLLPEIPAHAADLLSDGDKAHVSPVHASSHASAAMVHGLLECPRRR